MNLSMMKKVARRLGRPAAYAAGFMLIPLVAGYLGLSGAAADAWFSPPAPFVSDEAAPPAYDPSKPIAVVLAGNVVTEVSDFSLPFTALGASGAFNVYAVAPKRQISTLSSGLDILPHFSFEEFARTFRGRAPDLIVIPYIPDPSDVALIAPWIRAHTGPHTTLLSICAGAGLLAESGLLGGRTATSYWTFIPRFERQYPDTRWVRGIRWTEDGNVVASAGITSGLDATLHVIRRRV
jgi:AraC family transcriptional activator FtrA